ncbi:MULTISPECIES: MlaD family protein [Ramlibacter]|jgi:phospholipid/cholesterol/gamma-HCH transport system substrate-binding protein|uniref:MCE family protein n=1 Tax=Ramlibacter pinisoli TaxID=2682844 RepID=A0A6N8J127_9BURK|nr:MULTISPECIES: MlaD family protein [Ramlibacter]MBA2963057.1 MCE family protein [Ramlibacter sp. CGMCC 1.13660]MVQ33001.1 MCE family protein [Ramlibacter pinisoli]
MENKAHALAAGLFVLALTALLLVLGAWLTRDQGPRERYEISTREPVTGLQAQAPVRYRGVDVGKVAEIGFDPKVQGNVLIRLDVDHGAPVTGETFATLSFQGVTGLAFVQLDDSGKPSIRLAPADGAPPRIPLRPGLLSKLTDKGEAILGQVEQITERLNQLVDGPNQQRLTEALDNIARAAANIGTLSADVDRTLTTQFSPQRVDIPALVKRVDSTLASLHDTSEQARVTIGEINRTAGRLNEKDGPIDRLAIGAASLSHAADSFNLATLPRVNRVTEDTSRAVRQLSRTVNGINDNPQSLIFGTGRVDPGPGEAGFTAPGGAR